MSKSVELAEMQNWNRTNEVKLLDHGMGIYDRVSTTKDYTDRGVPSASIFTYYGKPIAVGSTIAKGLRTLSDPPENKERAFESMEISITTAIFMVILIAISAILLLCCCKAYLLCCKQRATSFRRREDEISDSYRRSFHQQLPVRCRLTDEPPCYEDVLSGRIKTVNVSGYHDLMTLKPNNDETSLTAKLTPDGDDTAEPPLYSCVIEGIHSANCNTTPPPSYYAIPITSCDDQQEERRQLSSGIAHRPRKGVALVRKGFDGAIQTVSALVFSRKASNQTPNENQFDSACEITCDGDITRDLSSPSTPDLQPSSSAIR